MNGVTTSSLSPLWALWNWNIREDANYIWLDGKDPVHLYYNFLLIIFIKLCRISGSLNLVLNNNEIPLVLWLITNFKKKFKGHI